jgi:hypothetical protein
MQIQPKFDHKIAFFERLDFIEQKGWCLCNSLIIKDFFGAKGETRTLTPCGAGT